MCSRHKVLFWHVLIYFRFYYQIYVASCFLEGGGRNVNAEQNIPVFSQNCSLSEAYYFVMLLPITLYFARIRACFKTRWVREILINWNDQKRDTKTT